MQISISGSTGFIGSELNKLISRKGWTVNVMNRQSFEMPENEFLLKKIEGSDIIINLAGAPLLKRWTESYKKEIYQSRISATRKIAQAINLAALKPKVFISASAIGIYDDIHTHTEESLDLADNFLGKICKDWEKEALEAAGSTRIVIMRTGVVLGKSGGALKMMFKPFNAGLGGVIGRGNQAFSWIHIDDLMNIYQFAIENEPLSGVVNAVSPNPTTNYYFTKTFGKVLVQPTVFRIPFIVLRSLYGEGAKVLTEGQRVQPEKLLKNGFEFKFPTIEKALLNLYK